MFFAQRLSYVSQFELLVVALHKTKVGESCLLTQTETRTTKTAELEKWKIG